MADKKSNNRRPKNDYEPFFVGEKFQIIPPDKEVNTGDRMSLIMDRGAFGSGEHETTHSCIEWLEQFPEKSSFRVFDFGSGTGILSIAAIKLGATESWCLDIDEKAVTCCKRNCALNNVSTQVSHFNKPLGQFKESDFDLLLANIYGDILLAEADKLANKVKSGAWLILSGILWEDNFAVRKKFTALGCRVIKNRLLEDYSSILLQKI